MVCICYCLIRKKVPSEKKEEESEIPKLTNNKMKEKKMEIEDLTYHNTNNSYDTN